MSDMKAKMEQMTGKAKEAAGKVTGDGETEGEGKADQMKGQAKEAMEDVKEKAGDAAAKIKGMLKRD